jgi:hypothetical protein
MPDWSRLLARCPVGDTIAMQLKMVVFAGPLTGREDEFLAWYDGTHMKDMLQLEGIVSVERYNVMAEPGRPSPPGPSLTVFTWEVRDIAEARAILSRAQQEDIIPLQDSMDRTLTRSWFFVPSDGSK